jgi:DNA polymerase-3 subunit alpha
LGTLSIAEIKSERIGDRVTIGGIVSESKKIVTKQGNSEMAFVKLEDLTGTIEIVVFPKIYGRTSQLVVRDSIILVSGRIDEKDDRLTLLADDIKPMNVRDIDSVVDRIRFRFLQYGHIVSHVETA